MKPGGEDVYPAEVETVIMQMDGVSGVCVYGIPDPKWGEIVVAAVTLRAGKSVDEAELIAHCKKHLSTFKIPKRIDFRDQMPLSSFGKILRRDVRKAYWQQQEVQV